MSRGAITDGRVYIYAYSYLDTLSVCAPESMSQEELEQRVNLLVPTGIESKWKISKATHFKGGEPNPTKCNDTKEGSTTQNLHYLMNC